MISSWSKPPFTFVQIGKLYRFVYTPTKAFYKCIPWPTPIYKYSMYGSDRATSRIEKGDINSFRDVVGYINSDDIALVINTLFTDNNFIDGKKQCLSIMKSEIKILYKDKIGWALWEENTWEPVE